MQDFLERAGCHRAGLSLSRAVIFRKTATSRKAACHFNLKILAQAPGKILAHAQDKICTYTEKFHFTLQFLRKTAEFSRKIVCVTHVFSICRKNCFLYTRIHKFLDMGSRKISIYTIQRLFASKTGASEPAAHIFVHQNEKNLYMSKQSCPCCCTLQNPSAASPQMPPSIGRLSDSVVKPSSKSK